MQNGNEWHVFVPKLIEDIKDTKQVHNILSILAVVRLGPTSGKRGGGDSIRRLLRRVGPRYSDSTYTEIHRLNTGAAHVARAPHKFVRCLKSL